MFVKKNLMNIVVEVFHLSFMIPRSVPGAHSICVILLSIMNQRCHQQLQLETVGGHWDEMSPCAWGQLETVGGHWDEMSPCAWGQLETVGRHWDEMSPCAWCQVCQRSHGNPLFEDGGSLQNFSIVKKKKKKTQSETELNARIQKRKEKKKSKHTMLKRMLF